jgi:hypothetical protein
MTFGSSKDVKPNRVNRGGLLSQWFPIDIRHLRNFDLFLSIGCNSLKRSYLRNIVKKTLRFEISFRLDIVFRLSYNGVVSDDYDYDYARSLLYNSATG